MVEGEDAVVLTEATRCPVRTSTPLTKRSLAGSAETTCPSIDTPADPGAIVVLSRMYSLGSTTNCAEAIVMVSSCARTVLAMSIMMKTSPANKGKAEAFMMREDEGR